MNEWYDIRVLFKTMCLNLNQTVAQKLLESKSILWSIQIRW